MAYFRCGGGGHSDAEYNNLMDQLVEETATGPIASFTDGANNIPTKEVICHINPTETGTGEKSPQNPYVIGGHNEINITRTGVNLWDEEWEIGGYNTTTGIKTTATNRIRNKNYIPVVSGETYFLAAPEIIRFFYYDINKSFITSVAVSANNTFTIPSGVCFINFQASVAYGTTYNNDISINYPSTDTEYHAYTGDTKTIDLGQTVYGGSLNVTTGELSLTHTYQKINRIQTQGTSGGKYFYRVGLGSTYPLGINTTATNKTSQKCNVFNFDTTYSLGSVLITSTGTSLHITPTDQTLDTVEKMKEWLSNNDMYICYLLAEPITIQVTPTEIKTLLGANNIYHDCNGDIDVTYRANGALYVQEHPITRGLMAARPTEQIQDQEEQQEEKEINKSEDNEK